jgi:D-beta-D-heptose 7-phosphate kinase/D-beta-D-heptose 1-phosphate adenosyltransferase
MQKIKLKKNNKSLSDKKTTSSKKSSAPKKIVIAVSGGFDPLHPGHVRMFTAAKKLGDELVVILNNDNWLLQKKGFVFMPEKQRKEVLQALKSIDRVIISEHKKKSKDISVCAELAKLRPTIFANGGDRFKNNIPEVVLAKKLGIKLVFGIGQGGKVESSSWLLSNYAEFIQNKSKKK